MLFAVPVSFAPVGTAWELTLEQHWWYMFGIVMTIKLFLSRPTIIVVFTAGLRAFPRSRVGFPVLTGLKY